MSPKRLFRIFAVAEAITWTILIVAMVLKYAFHVEPAVLVGGSIHGFVFLAYAGIAILVGVNQRWSLGAIAFGVLTAVVPYATVPYELWLVRRGRLDGEWRLEPGSDAGDRHWTNRVMYWLLARPVVLGAVFVVAVAAIFAALLVVGPPGGREA